MTVKVLIIDDDVDTVEAEKLLLENCGYEVIFAFDSKEGYRKIKEHKPDVIILDVMMTTQDEWFEIAHNIKKDPSLYSLHIIMTTSLSSSKMSKKGYDSLPVDIYIEKPIDPEQLLNAVERVLINL